MGFAKFSGGKFRGCICASDGFCIRIVAPNGVKNIRYFWNHKKFYVIDVQDTVDSTGKFVAESFVAGGTTHDSFAMKMSTVWERLNSGILCRPE